MHQHCCLNLPLPAPNPLSSPMMDIISLEHFWKKMPFFCFIFSLKFAFWSYDEMWIRSYLNWLPTWREQRWCVWSSHIIRLSLTQGPPPTHQATHPTSAFSRALLSSVETCPGTVAEIWEQSFLVLKLQFTRAAAHSPAQYLQFTPKCWLQSGLWFPIYFSHDPHPRKAIYYLLNGSFFSVAGKSYFRN